MWNRLPLWRMREALERGEVSAGEIVEAHLAAIAETNPRVNAFIEVYADEARLAARRQLRGPLAGVPVTVKDSFDLEGRVTYCGSLLRREERAARDSTAAARLKAAGAIVIGKTSTPEFLYYYETDNRIIGRTCHPWNSEYTAGGSSGGEAAAIAAFMSAGGIGSDGGGSIREPAHFCGICGLKPTPGRVGGGGHWPVLGHPAGFMGAGGPMARTARDVRLLFETLAGWDVRDPFSAPVALQSPDVRRSKVALWVPDGVRPECAAAAVRTAERLWQGGFGKADFDKRLIEGAHGLWRVLFVDLITQSLRAMIAGREHECAWTGVALMQEARETVSTERLLAVLAERDAMRARLLEHLDAETVVVAPAFGTAAFPHRQPPIPILDAARPLTPANLLGLPAMVAPAGVNGEGMPVGVQFIGAPYEDERLIGVAEIFEELRGDAWPSETLSPSTTNSSTSPTA
jgi:Asp-tRNA(Asn)/Glu-tRNA(Gln) amidotransferase A subunit family amidase